MVKLQKARGYTVCQGHKYVVVKDTNLLKQLCGDFLEARVDDKGSH